MGRTPRVPSELRLRPFSLDEARAAGLSLSALRGRSWERVGSKMYRWAGGRDDGWGTLQAWRAALPASAAFAGHTAAWMHRLDAHLGAVIEVTMPRRCRLESRYGLKLRHCEVAHDLVLIRGLRATSLERTLLDLSGRLSPPDALAMLDVAVFRRMSNPKKLRRYADRHAGLPGSVRMRSLAPLAAAAESPMESRLRWLLIESGLPRPEVQTNIHDGAGRFVGRADLFYPASKLVIEFDGGNHRDRLVADDRRQNSIVAAGFRILRFTTADMRNHPEAVVAKVSAEVSRTAWAGSARVRGNMRNPASDSARNRGNVRN